MSAWASSSRSGPRPRTAWSGSRRPSPRPGSTPSPAPSTRRRWLANEIAAAAMEHVSRLLRPGMKCSEAAAIWQGFVHGQGTGWRTKVDLALPFSLVWSGPSIKTFTATGDSRVQENEPTLFEIWVCADGYWADHTKNLCPGELRPEYARLEEGLAHVYTSALHMCTHGSSLAELDRSVREGLAEIGYPGQPSHPICHGIGARAHEPPYAHQAGGGRRGRAARRGQLPDHRGRGREALALPRRDRADMSSEIWTGALNDAYRLGGSVGLYDTTLRDGEQTVGVVLDPEQKLEIARLLDELGIDRIEAGFPRVSQDDWRAVELIAGAGLRAEVWGFSRAVPADLEALVELGVPASVIESPISDLKLDAIGVPREKMLDRITSAMQFAAEHGIHAAFFGVDSTRAAPDFYERVYKSAVDAGAKEVVVVDTLGIASPEAVAELVGRTVDWVGADVPVHFHGHNDFGLATAAAVAAVRAGARWVHGTINGMGERAGNANLGEVALTLRALYGVESHLELDRVRDVSERVRELSGYELEPWKPVTGETLFRRESGAVASQFHDPPSIEPYSSRLVAAERAIVLGKKSGLDSIRIKAEELGLDVPEEKRAELLARVKELGASKRGLVSDDEFKELAGA
ncbi:MAG: M24 family metallopeptidase [Actinobacteria bacterium]|nr:MAG: M24 family metallopeptidase [Actinomycetota bacterium]